MPISLPDGPSAEPVTAESSRGSIQFIRSSPTDAQMKLEYSIPGLAADLRQMSLEDAVDALCQTEIAKMRSALHELGEALAQQLSQDGLAPNYHHRASDDDERTWQDRRTALLIRPSVFDSTLTFRGYEGVADAKLVLATIEEAIKLRESAIRKVFHQLLHDVRAQRRAKARPQHEAGAEPQTDSPLDD